MAVDVIIDPSNGQIYWNDNQATAQSIAISGNASDKINFIGYSGAFGGTAGTAPNDPVTRVTINDSASATLVPGTNGHELGSSSYRWAVSATTLDASGAITLSYSPVTGVNNNHTLRITSAPFAETTGAVIEMGATTAFDGTTANYFSGSANGTYIAIQAASTFSGNFLQFGLQDSTGARFSVGSGGSTTVKANSQFAFNVNNFANGNVFIVDTSNTRIGLGKPADYPADFRSSTANTNTINTILALESKSSGTTAAGFGSGAIFTVQNSSGTVVSSSGIDGILSEVGASYKGSIVFKTNSSGTNTLNERVRISYNNILLSPYESTGTLELRFNALTGTNYVGFKAPDTISSSVMWTLPSTIGTSGQFLKVGASGVLSWDTPAAGTGTVTSITAGTGLTGGTITTSGTIAIDTSVVPTLTATSNAFTSGNSTGQATSSALSLVTNSLTTGYGLHLSSNSLTSGRMINVAMTGTAGATGRTGLHISATGTHTTGGISTYGIIVDNQSASTSSANFGIVSYAGNGTGTSLNIPLRIGLSTSKYVNFLVDSESGIRLSPFSNAFHLSLGPYGSTTGNTSELRFMELSANGLNYIGFKAPDAITSNVIWTLPTADGTASTTTFLATNGSGALSFPSSVTLNTSTGVFSASLLSSTQSLANEGGEIQLALPSSGSTLSTSVTIDVYQNRLRFFETGGTARGAYIDLTACSGGAGTNLLSGTGSTTPGGTNNGDIQYKSGTSFAGSANLNYDATNNELKVLNYNPTNSSSTAALKVLNGTTWTGSGNGTLIAGNAVTGFTGNLLDLRVAGNQKLQLDYNGGLKIANAYTLPTTTPTEGQVLTFDGTNLIWGTAGSGSGTVNSGSSGKIAYYPSAGTTVDDASALDYATTGTNLTITASGTGVIPLAVTGITSQTAAIFKAILNTTDVFVINNSGNISTGTWNASTIGVLYGGTGQTTYTDGQLLIGNTSGNTLTKSTLTAGSGIAVTNGAGSIAIRQKRPLYLTFCSGFTPAVSGVDSVVLRIPDSPADGSSSITYNVRELFMRVETASAGTTSVHVQYYTGTGAFSSTGNLMSTALSITGASTYEASTTSFSQTTLASGNKVRLNFTALDGTHTNFFIQLVLEES